MKSIRKTCGHKQTSPCHLYALLVFLETGRRVVKDSQKYAYDDNNLGNEQLEDDRTKVLNITSHCIVGL